MANKKGAAGYIAAVTAFIFHEDRPEQADVILIPGCAEPRHALRAAELYLAGYAPYVLPSGRYSKVTGHFAGVEEPWRHIYTGAYETEWAFLRDVLRRAGVPDSAILREDQATYTWENAQYSRNVLRDAGIPCNTAILCCKGYHARRALLYYQAAMPHTRFLVCPAQTPGCTREDWYMSEKGRTRVLGEVARLGSQVNEVFSSMLEEKPASDR